MRIEGFKLIDMGLRLFILLFRDGERIYVRWGVWDGGWNS